MEILYIMPKKHIWIEREKKIRKKKSSNCQQENWLKIFSLRGKEWDRDANSEQANLYLHQWIGHNIGKILPNFSQSPEHLVSHQSQDNNPKTQETKRDHNIKKII